MYNYANLAFTTMQINEITKALTFKNKISKKIKYEFQYTAIHNLIYIKACGLWIDITLNLGYLLAVKMSYFTNNDLRR